MPLPESNSATGPSICVYGDSHLGAVKEALDSGLLPQELSERLGLWGAAGPSFRALRMDKHGRIAPDPAAQAAVDVVRGDGPATLGPDDYDGFIFYHARFRVGDVFQELYEHVERFGPLSDAVLDLCVQRGLDRTRSVRIARRFVLAGAPVVLVPTSQDVEGISRTRAPAPTMAFDPQSDVVKRVREKMEASLAADGLKVCWQIEDTLTERGFTHPDHAIENASELRDPVHKSADFAARHLQAAFEMLRPQIAGRGDLAKTG